MSKFKLEIDANAIDDFVELTMEQIENVIAPAVAADASRAAPVDSGRLRGSVRVERSGDQVDVIADTEYSAFVEQGTSNQTAQPFLRPALYQERT